MVSLLTLFPLLLTIFLCLTFAFYVMKRKILAQSLCVQQVTRLQNDLKDPLRKLLQMNTHATVLRAKRKAAESNLESATMSAYPPAIAAAEAQLAAVILEQTEFHGRQLALLGEAERLRSESRRNLRQRIEPLDAFHFRTQRFYIRALAVEPTPEFDLSPNYETVPGFTQFQQHRYSYQVDLLGYFAGHFPFKLDSVQNVNCAVSLEERGDEWGIRILAARAP